MFFRSFDTIEYSLDGYSKQTLNIITAAVIRRLNVDQTYVYREHTISDSDTIDSLSYKLYDEPTWGWTILLVNGMVNPFLDWPMDNKTLEKFIVDKHGSPNNLVEFRRLDNGWVCDEVDHRDYYQMWENNQTLPANITPVSAYQYESEKNDEKRNIKIIAPRYIRKFVDVFEKEISKE